MHQLDFEGKTVRWWATGDGPALLLIHGAGGNAAVWWQQAEAFAGRHRVIAYDLPGFGASAAGDPTDFVPRLAGTAAAVLDAAGVHQATVVCQSLGGWSGLRLALEQPGRVSRLVLACTMAGIAHPPALRAFQVARQSMDERGPAALGLTPEFRARSPAKAALYDRLNAFNPPLSEDLGRLAFAPETLVSPSRLGQVACPVLLIAGENDPIWPPASLADLVPAFPNARMETIPKAGHSVYFEQPDIFNDVLAAFLAA